MASASLCASVKTKTHICESQSNQTQEQKISSRVHRTSSCENITVTSSKSQKGKARQLIPSDLTRKVSPQTPKEKGDGCHCWLLSPASKGPSPCLQEPPLLLGKLCAQTGQLFLEDAASTFSSANPIMPYTWITMLVPTSSSLRLKEPSFRYSCSCFSDPFVHARDNSVSEYTQIYNSNMQPTHSLLLCVCV